MEEALAEPAGLLRTLKPAAKGRIPPGRFLVRRRCIVTCVDNPIGRSVRSVGRSVLSDSKWRLIADSLKLSPRELEVVQHVFDDDREAVIAEEMGISRHTVHSYLERIYLKLRVASRCKLVVRIFQEHIAREPAVLTEH